MGKKTKNSKKSISGTENSCQTDAKYFLIQTKGYKKQFTNESAARRKFNSLEKSKMEAEEPFKIALSCKTDIKSDWTELDFVQVSEFE